MTIRQSPYECLVLKPMRATLQRDIVDFINGALISGHCGDTRSLRLCLIGETQDTIWNYRYFADLKGWLHPVPIYNREFPDHVGIFTDMRHYGSIDPVKGEYRVRAEAEHRFAKLRSLMQYRWSTEGTKWLRDFSDLPCWMYCNWIADAITRRFNLDQQEQFKVQVIAGLFYQTLHSDDHEWSDIDQVRIPRVLSKVTFGKPQVISEAMREHDGKLTDLDSLCAAIQTVSPIKLSDFNTGLLATMVGTNWFNSNVREVMAVALEHPPTWVSVMFMTAMDRSFNRTVLGTLFQRKKKNEQDAFLECLQPLVFLHGLSLEDQSDKLTSKERYGELQKMRNKLKSTPVVTPVDRLVVLIEATLFKLDFKFKAKGEPDTTDVRKLLEAYPAKDNDVRQYLRTCGGISHPKLTMDYLSATEILKELNDVFDTVELDSELDKGNWIPFARNYNYYAWVNTYDGEVVEGSIVDISDADKNKFVNELDFITHRRYSSLRKYLALELGLLEDKLEKQKANVSLEALTDATPCLMTLEDTEIYVVRESTPTLVNAIKNFNTEFEAWSKRGYLSLRARLRPSQLLFAIIAELRRQDPRVGILREPNSEIVRDWRIAARIDNRNLIEFMEVNPGLEHPYLRCNYFSAYQSMKLIMQLRTLDWEFKDDRLGDTHHWVPFGSSDSGVLLVHTSKDIVVEGLFKTTNSKIGETENGDDIVVQKTYFELNHRKRTLSEQLEKELDTLENR